MSRLSRRPSPFRRAAAALAGLAACGLFAAGTRAGGPLVVVNNRPVIWSRSPVTGPPPLSSQTVDAEGRVLYRVDSGPLGPLTNAEAVALVDRIFGLYNDVPTASIEFVNAGPIRNPSDGEAVDVTDRNVGRFLGDDPTFQNPIIFDHDGQITGSGGVLGFFAFLQFGSGGTIVEGTVVLNGSTVDAVGGAVPFGGVFTHEFGHFAGPLDHAQSNGNIATDGDGAVLPPGFTSARAYDLYAPFTETLFPFLFGAPSGSVLAGRGFANSGYFVASLDMDTRNALSILYPEPGFRATDPGSPNGAIAGRVVIRTSSGDIPLTGVNVVARRVNLGAYPPSPSTEAFPNSDVPVDGQGVPLPPPALPATDSLVTVQSAVTGHAQPAGAYLLDGLPPGDYLVEIQQINPFALGGSGIGPLGQQIPLPVPENYNGPDESGAATDDPSAFVPVTVVAGAVAGNVDVVLNGFPTTPLTDVDEREPNEKAKRSQSLALPSEAMGRAREDDRFRSSIDFGFATAPLHDFYSFTLTGTRTVFISLEGVSGSGDMDLYLLSGKIGRRIDLDSPRLLGASLSPSSSEFIAVTLPAGRYFLGVSAFSGDVTYSLRGLVTD
jgi:hypothetical protein